MDYLLALSICAIFSSVYCFFMRNIWQRIGYQRGYREGFIAAREVLAAGYRRLILIRGQD